MKRNLLLGALLLGAVALAGACSSATPAPAPAATAAPAAATAAPVATTAPTAASAAPAATAPSAAQPNATGGAPAVAPQAEPGTPQPTRDVQANLPALNIAGLNSYVAHMEMRDEPVKVSTPFTPTAPVTMEMQYHGAPPPAIYAWNLSGQAQAPGAAGQAAKMLMVGPNLYSWVPEQGKWLQMPAGSPQGLPLKEDLLDPNRLAQSAPTGLFNKANIVNAHEMVDGVDTTHYRASDTQMKELLQGAGDQNRTPQSGTADFWVENGSGYLKQYVMVANLKDQQGQEFKQTITYKLGNENKPVTIATPAPNQIITMEQLQQSLQTPAASGAATAAAPLATAAAAVATVVAPAPTPQATP